VWQTSPMGPFDAWPTGGGGFEHFYSFIGAETNQWAPAIYRDTVPVEPDRTPEEGYHFAEDMTDRAIEWIGQQKSLMPDKPFFVYYAPGATTHRTMCRSSGRTVTPDGSTPGGTRSARTRCSGSGSWG
jgi:arylsulfatase A-like enzyme